MSIKKHLIRAVVFTIFIISALIISWFMVNGGAEYIKNFISEYGFGEFIKHFFKTLVK